MIDLFYLLAIVGVFAAMFAYIRGLEALGRRTDSEPES